MSKRILMVEHQKDDRQIGLRTPGKLIFPEVFESVRSQGRVADRGHDRSVAEIGLDCAMDSLRRLSGGFFGYVWGKKYRACFAAN